MNEGLRYEEVLGMYLLEKDVFKRRKEKENTHFG